MTKSIDDAATVAPWKFDLYVEAEADGVATPEELAVLEADRLGWRASLQRLLLESEEHLAAARTSAVRSATRCSPTRSSTTAGSRWRGRGFTARSTSRSRSGSRANSSNEG